MPSPQDRAETETTETTTTTTTTDPTDTTVVDPPGEPLHRRRIRLPSFDLSVTQLMASGLAAITATVAASFLGVTGTVIGAALASMTTAAGNVIYGQSLRRGRDRVRGAVPVLARPSARHDAAAATTPAASPAAPTAGTAAVSRPLPVRDTPPELPAARPVRSVVWKRAAFGAVSVFVAVLAVVTGVEVVAGRPIADVVRGDSGSGTSFFGDTQVRTRTTTVTPAAPTITVTVTPKVVVTTPTVTQTAPTRTATATPSTTQSGTPTSTGSASPTDSPSRGASTSSSP